MSAKFDPAEARKYWQTLGLKFHGQFVPEGTPLTARALYASSVMNSLINPYFVGLGDRSKPILRRLLTGLKVSPRPIAGKCRKNMMTGEQGGALTACGGRRLASANG